jgi:hypothetical protein
LRLLALAGLAQQHAHALDQRRLHMRIERSRNAGIAQIGKDDDGMRPAIRLVLLLQPAGFRDRVALVPFRLDMDRADEAGRRSCRLSLERCEQLAEMCAEQRRAIVTLAGNQPQATAAIEHRHETLPVMLDL